MKGKLVKELATLFQAMVNGHNYMFLNSDSLRNQLEVWAPEFNDEK